MRVLGIAGMSVTMPHKHDVAAAVDRLDSAAAALHSVNTVSWDGDELVGSSTDGAGFVASLAEDGIDVAGAGVAIIGAGGAARSVIDALGRAGVDSITCDQPHRRVGRVRQRAGGRGNGRHDRGHPGCGPRRQRLQRRHGRRSPAMQTPSICPATRNGCGRRTSLSTSSTTRCTPPGWRSAEHIGARTIDGLGMLIHQAALQQVAWLGQRPDVAVMRRAAEAALAGGPPSR